MNGYASVIDFFIVEFEYYYSSKRFFMIKNTIISTLLRIYNNTII